MKNKRLLMIIAVLALAIGFAAVSTSLILNGTTGVASNTEDYDVYFSNAIINGEEDKSVIIDDTNIKFTTEMKTIGEQYILNYYITNGSKNYDSNVTMDCSSGNNYVTVSNSWINPTTILSTETKNGTLTLEMIKSYAGDEPIELKITCTITASAAERESLGTGTPADKVEQGVAQVSFADDSWETIQKAVQSGDYIYQVGDTKTITLASHTNDCSSYSGSRATYVCNSSVEPEKQVTVRVANTTECTNGESSETGCGFVVEFVDITDRHNFNKADATNTNGTNVGGWRDSAMRTYVNGILYNALPSDLQNVIANTTVVSGHGATSGETNFTTTDKLYLLNTQEVWGTDSLDTSAGTSRQLDYYKNSGVTESNYEGAIKQYNGGYSSWWLRSANASSTGFLLVSPYGKRDADGSHNTYGVSAAFRIV